MAKFRCRPVDMPFTVVCDNFALINLVHNNKGAITQTLVYG